MLKWFYVFLVTLIINNCSRVKPYEISFPKRHIGESGYDCRTYLHNIISDYWKMDSLGSNGFRFYTHIDIHENCEDYLIGLSEEEVMYIFGLPNKIRETNVSIDLLYNLNTEATLYKKYSATSYFLLSVNKDSLVVFDIGKWRIDW